jgi:hypothetical protein
VERVFSESTRLDSDEVVVYACALAEVGVAQLLDSVYPYE